MFRAADVSDAGGVAVLIDITGPSGEGGSEAIRHKAGPRDGGGVAEEMGRGEVRHEGGHQAD